jgi:uncharacterized protein (TIGR02099 family)
VPRFLNRALLSRLARILAWFLGLLVFSFLACLLFARFWLAPRLPQYLPEIQASLSQSAGQPVRIGAIEMDWTELKPSLTLRDVGIGSGVGGVEGEAEALTVERIDARLSWRSLWAWKPVFSLLALEHPRFSVHWTEEGGWRIAGMPAAPEGDGAGLEWLLAQRRIRVQGAEFSVRDERGIAPTLFFSGIAMDWRNSGSRHRFGLNAKVAASEDGRENEESGAKALLDIRGDLYGNSGMPFSRWEGQIYARLEAGPLAAWRHWLGPAGVDASHFALDAAKGAAQLWLERQADGWQGTADVALADVRTRLGENLPELRLHEAAGRLELARDKEGKWRFSSHGLRLREENEEGKAGNETGKELLAPLDLTVSWQEELVEKVAETAETAEALPKQFSLTANTLDFPSLLKLAAYLPLPDASRNTLRHYRPEGVLRNLRLDWDTRQTDDWRYALSADFSSLGILANGAMPGAQGLSGHVEADGKGGRLSLDSRQVRIALPAVFNEPSFPLGRLAAEVDWRRAGDTPGNVIVEIRRLDFSGPHATGQVSGRYESRPEEAGVIDLGGKFTRIKVEEVWRYIPKVSHPDTARWLRASLISGSGEAELTLRGNLEKFPFSRPEDDGLFKITVQARDVLLRYNKNWPDIEAIDADLEFGVGMQLAVRNARIFSTRIGSGTKVVIPDLFTRDLHLLVDGEVAGATAEFFRFIEKSPVAAYIDHFTSDMQGEGEGRLELKLDLPLHHMDESKVWGRYHLTDNRIRFLPELPAARAVRGTLEFTESGVQVPEIHGEFLGKPLRLSAKSQAGVVLIEAAGGFDTARLTEFGQRVPPLLLARLAGSAAWQAEIKVRKQAADFLVSSNLEGVEIRLPPPFAKSAQERLALRLQKTTLPQDRGQLVFSLGEKENRSMEGLVFLRAGQAEQGAIAIGQPLRLPRNKQSLHLLIRQPALDVDAWQEILAGATASPTTPATTNALPFSFSLVSVEAQDFHIFGHTLKEASLRVIPQESEKWKIMLASREAVGDLYWDSRGKGRITADLRRVRLEAGDSAQPTQPAHPTRAAQPTSPQAKLPAMDIRIGDFSYGAWRFGQVFVQAENSGETWRLNEIVIDNPDGKLTGNGSWQTAPVGRSRLDFQLAVADSGKLLGRFGYPNAMRGGTANLSGQLEWRGGPMQFDPDTLDGRLTIDARKGQFSKVEPGVGKLLGLLSLQSVSRRLSLDFRDIFSDGYAYDTLDAKLTIRTGTLYTDGDLKIVGPAGAVLMNGKVDMPSESQELTLTIQPELGGVAAVGVAVAVNPLVGAAALFAQNFLKNPLNRVFSLQYFVTGTWDDPKVERRTRFSENGEHRPENAP